MIYSRTSMNSQSASVVSVVCWMVKVIQIHYWFLLRRSWLLWTCRLQAGLCIDCHMLTVSTLAVLCQPVISTTFRTVCGNASRRQAIFSLPTSHRGFVVMAVVAPCYHSIVTVQYLNHHVQEGLSLEYYFRHLFGSGMSLLHELWVGRVT